MKGSSGVNNKKYIKETSFNTAYKTLLTEFYVKKYMTAKDLEVEYGIQPSTLSEMKAKVENAVGPLDNKNGGPISIFRITENQTISNPFFMLYRRCNDKDSEFDLYTLLAFWAVPLIQKKLSASLDSLDKKSMRIVVEAIKDAEENEYNATCCSLLKCSDKQREECIRTNSCHFSKCYKMCGNYATNKGLTKKELFTFLEGLFPKGSEEERSVFALSHADAKTTSEKLAKLVRTGILNYDAKKHVYRMTSDTIFSLIEKVERCSNCDAFIERFQAMVDFFSEYRPLGEIGFELSRRICTNLDEKPFRYNKRFVINTINDYNLIDILFAIENKMWLKVRCLKEMEDQIIYPIQIRISSKDGRQSLICYSPSNLSVQSIWLNLINQIQVGYVSFPSDKASEIEKEISLAKAALAHVWNIGFESISGGNCSLSNIFPLTHVQLKLFFEDIVKRNGQSVTNHLFYRFEREIRFGEYTKVRTENGYEVRLDLCVSDEKEIQIWLRTYLRYITGYSSEKVEKNMVTGELVPRQKYDNPVSCSQTNTLVWEPSQTKSPSTSQLFCEQTGEAYRRYSAILRKTIEEGVCPYPELNETIQEVSGASLEISQNREQIENIKRYYADPLRIFFAAVEKLVSQSEFSKDLEKQSLDPPMTLLERNWIREILADSLSDLFMTVEEKNSLVCMLDKTQDKKVFSFSNIYYTDRAKNNLSFNSARFKTLLQAVCQHKKAYIRYTNNKNAGNTGEYFLDSVQYSNLENTMNVYAYSYEKQSMMKLRFDFMEEIEIRDEVSAEDRILFRNIVRERIQYDSSEDIEDKMVKVALIGVSEEERLRFLHEMAAYTVSCDKQRTYDDWKKGELVSRILKLQTYNAGSFTCTIDDEERTGCSLRRVTKDNLYLEQVNSKGKIQTDYHSISVSCPDSLLYQLPCVALYPDDWFEYVATLHYPGNDYNEIVDALLSYRNVFVLSNRVFQPKERGEANREHSVVRKILEKEQEIGPLGNA